MKAKSILKENGMSLTRNRINILNILVQSNSPLSGKEINNSLKSKCNKSTVHRTINSLYAKNLLQRVIIDHEVKYALKQNHQPSNKKAGDHVHFKCSICEKLFCLHELVIEDFPLPDGFSKEENQFLIIGICKQCQQ